MRLQVIEAVWPQREARVAGPERCAVVRPEGHWTLDLTERGLDRTEIAHMPARRGELLLLLSDGFYRLVDVYRRYGCDTLLGVAESSGLAPLLDELRAIEVGDAVCRDYPRLKARDDAMAVLVKAV